MMKQSNHVNDDSERTRLYNMEINALVGYAISEAGILSARFLGLTSISYVNIFYISVVVNVTTVFFIIYLRSGRKFPAGIIRLFFIIQLIIYVAMYSITVIQANEFRLLVLVYALLAVSSLLPFATPQEIILVSVCSIAGHIGATYYAMFHLGQWGEFLHDLVYTLSFCPTMVMIIYVSRQINNQKKRIRYSMGLVEEMNSRLLGVNRELEQANRVARNELNLAAQLQMSILPEIDGKVRDWDIALAFVPWYGVSGDIYDFYIEGGDLKGISVFDVSGHGISSALLTMIVKPVAFRWFNQMRSLDLGEIIREINSSVSREISRIDEYITCVILRFRGDLVEYANAGHPDILIRRGKTGRTSVVDNGGHVFKGEPIGINMSGVSPRTLKFNAQEGDTLLIFTDCIMESKNYLDENYGMSRILASLQDAPDGSAGEVLRHVLARFELFTAGSEIKDDLTVIVAKKIR